MRATLLLLAIAVFCISCTPAKVTRQDIEAKAETLDYGDFTSATLVSKSWQASADKKYPDLFAYTQNCVELYGAEGKKMNAELSGFEPISTAAELWALNDVGTCLYIMANAYEDLKMYPEAVEAYATLANDYSYAQCWDPKGWFWHPARGAEAKVKQYKYKK
ncbi:MAG: beta-glucanase precursor [Gammaproteobacteria bacterium]|jgi:hypothetical protein|nr:beta-glucanase precursor [Gammaproteobacteria bacterium]MDH3986024.1 beta-glucanase precursor [Gammaproteobacteria bacterium]